MVFEDRISAYPGRYKMTDENGNESHVVLVRDDDPTVEGTPLNADTFNRMQEEYQVESEEYPGCFYRVLNDVEYWVNPPMMESVEYRTTERHNGKPVYAKYGESATVFEETSGQIGVRVASDVSDEVVEVSATMKNATTGATQTLPWFADDGTLYASFSLSPSKAGKAGLWAYVVIHNEACIGYRPRFRSKYIKADDVG